VALTAGEVTLRYGSTDVVRRLSCEVRPGEMVGVLGPNGSGKSTLMRCLARALRPRSGAVLLDGRDLYTLSQRQAAARLSYAAQEASMSFGFTVAEAVAVGGTRAAGEALRLLDLERIAGRSLLTLSGGERQRTAVARALAQDTPYVLLDEPTAHLDLRHQFALLTALRGLAHDGGRGILVVLHDLNLASAYADRILLLREGELVAQGSAAQVLTPETIRFAYQTEVLLVAGHGPAGRWVVPPPV
jgi:iron complex transport system ATP-binding protein